MRNYFVFKIILPLLFKGTLILIFQHHVHMILKHFLLFSRLISFHSLIIAQLYCPIRGSCIGHNMMEEPLPFPINFMPVDSLTITVNLCGSVKAFRSMDSNIVSHIHRLGFFYIRCIKQTVFIQNKQYRGLLLPHMIFKNIMAGC